MYCTKCGSPLIQGEKFCRSCGNVINAQQGQQANPTMGNSQGTAVHTQQPVGPAQGMNNVNAGVGQQVNPAMGNMQGTATNYQRPVQGMQQNYGQAYANGVNSNRAPKQNKNMLWLLIGGGVLLLAIIVGVVLLVNANKPTNVYKAIVEEGIKQLYELDSGPDNRIAVSIDLNLESKDTIDNSLYDFINKTTLGFEYQYDEKAEQKMYIIDADYDKDSLLDLKVFVDSKNKKTYIYAQDLYSKSIEIDNSDVESSMDNLPVTDELDILKISNAKKSKEIVIKEFSKIIDLAQCRKEDGMYVLEITEKDLVDGIKTALENLKNNEKFLSYYEDQDEMKETLEDVIESLEEIETTNETLTIKIEKGFFSTKLGSIEFITKDQEISLKITENGDTTTVKVSLSDSETGKLELEVSVTTEKIKTIDKVDTSNAIKIDEMTSEDEKEITSNLENTKLYEIISTAIGSMMGGLTDGTISGDDDYSGWGDISFSTDSAEDGDIVFEGWTPPEGSTADITFTSGDQTCTYHGSTTGTTTCTNSGSTSGTTSGTTSGSTSGRTDTLKVTSDLELTLNEPNGFETSFNGSYTKTYKNDDVTITVRKYQKSEHYRLF